MSGYLSYTAPSSPLDTHFMKGNDLMERVGNTTKYTGFSATPDRYNGGYRFEPSYVFAAERAREISAPRPMPLSSVLDPPGGRATPLPPSSLASGITPPDQL